MFSFGIKLLVHSAFICITFGIEDSTNCTDLLALRNSLLQALDNVTTLLAADCTSQSELDNSILPRDCQDIKELGHHETGEYTIRPIMATDGFKVRCDMDTDGGGWTVIQRRVSDSDFYKTWNEYKFGFGNLNDNFWLGNEHILTLTRSEGYALRIDLTTPDGESRYAQYDYFAIEDEDWNYRLSISGYKGNAGNSLKIHDNMKFSTKDNDYDTSSLNCAVRYHGAWWYESCHNSNLNGLYGSTEPGSGLTWGTWKGNTVSMIKTEMKIKRK